MATKATKKNGSKERAAVSKERRLALAVRAILDATDGDNLSEELTTACRDAEAELIALNYSNLIGIPKQVAALTAELKAATEIGNWSEVAQLGRQLERVKAGRAVPKSSASPAAKKSSKKREKTAGTQSTETEKDDAGDATTTNEGE